MLYNACSAFRAAEEALYKFLLLLLLLLRGITNKLPLGEVSPRLSAVVAQLPDVQPAFSSVHDVLKKEIS